MSVEFLESCEALSGSSHEVGQDSARGVCRGLTLKVPLSDKRDRQASRVSEQAFAKAQLPVITGSANGWFQEGLASNLTDGNRTVMGLAAKLPLRGSPTGTRSLWFELVR